LSIPCERRESERGQAILLVVVAMGIVLLGALGFAIDGSQLFAQRRMAQAAADAAAQAGIMSMLNGTNLAGPHRFDTGSSFTCASADDRTPCYFAQNSNLNGFGASSDTVTVDFPASVPGVANGISFIKVTVQRTVPTTLMRFLGASTTTIGATATAAIVSNPTNAQIIVTGNGPGTFSLVGTATLTISGGANRVIQVNSNDSGAVDASGGTVTLTTGADFSVLGGPNTAPFALSAGTYVQPGSPIPDPLAGVVSPPSVPPDAPSPTIVASGVDGCVSVGPGGTCTLYSPGRYGPGNPNPNTAGINVANQAALFKPGIYYMSGAASFVSGPNGFMQMASGTGPDDTTGSSWTANMLVYLTGGGNISVGSGGTVNLVGSPFDSAYKGILFYADSGGVTLDTTGNLTLLGTIYSPSSTLNLQGTRSLTITGDIITNRLVVSGNPTVSFSGAATVYNTRQVALVN